MLVSLTWLRALCSVTESVEAVAEALTSRGLTVDAVSPAGDDHVLDIDVPANRPDCLGHLGLARELSAVFGVPLAERAPPPQGVGPEVGSSVTVAIDDPDLCWRYTARLVRDVAIGPSPDWVARRLEACGLRSINNVVDASNLVMLELGNPIHFFDLECIDEATVRIRRAAPGETLTTLDGVERALEPEMLLIADAERPIAVAGVMGGADSEIGISTRDILIEAAHFLPRSVRATSRRLGLKTDASHRFERGVDPEGAALAQDLAVSLLVELAGGQPCPGIVDVWPGRCEPRNLVLRQGQLPRLLGYDPGPETTIDALRALRLEPNEIDGQRFEITVPSWRVDLEREADLVEEVARHLGYDRIPAGTTGLPTVIAAEGGGALESRARDLLTAGGFHEAFGYAMIADDEDARFIDTPDREALRLTNPISETMARLRRSILPGLLRAVDFNLRRGARDVRLFECGHVFLPGGRGEFPTESARVGIGWTGAGRPRHWSQPDREVDLLDTMGVVEHLLASLRPGTALRRERCEQSAFHPGKSSLWRGPDGRPFAWAGALHPELQHEHELGQPVFLAEIVLDELEVEERRLPRFAALPRLTPVTRDLSLVMESGTSYERIRETLDAVPPPAPVALEVIDRYEGPPLDTGQSSLTVRVCLRPDERTLTEAEIEAYRRALIEALERDLGIGIRGN